MGLFSKKPKSAGPTPNARAEAAKQTEAPKDKASGKDKPKPGKKVSIDPADFLALRSELMDLRARLDATEQAKAIVETRLAALDATTTTLANQAGSGGGTDVAQRLAELQSQLGTVSEAAAAAAANAEIASAKATAAATVASNAAAAPGGGTAAADPAITARLDELAVKVQTAANADPMLLARIEALNAKIESATAPLATRVEELASKVNTPAVAAFAAPPAADTSRLLAVEARLGELSAKVAEVAEAPAPAPAPEPVATVGPEVHARIDELAERVAAVDSFGAQLAQLNARVTAQAEFGAQLSSLRDRIGELQHDTDDRRTAALAATGDADLRDRVNAISDRLAAQDGLAAQIAQLAERVAANDSTARQATEQVSAIEQRLNAVSTELANQVSELGRDIDGLAAHQGDVAQGAVSDEVIDTLKASQVRLAAEQARYEIAFRQDLAALAEQVRRTPKP